MEKNNTKKQADTHGERFWKIINKGIFLSKLSVRVTAGKPHFVLLEPDDAPVDIVEFLGLNDECYLIGVTGDSMVDLRIYDGDWLVVNRAIEPVENKPVVFEINGELSLKLYKRKTNGYLRLIPANTNYKEIVPTEKDNVLIWGVVTQIIHKP